MDSINQFNEWQAAELCIRIAEGRLVKDVCSDDDMARYGVVLAWAHGKLGAPPTFQNEYLRARALCANSVAEDTLVIADSLDEAIRIESQRAYDSLGPDATPNQRRRARYAARLRSVEAAKLQVESRRWMASKLDPRGFGDKVDLTHRTDPEAPPTLNLSNLTNDELESLLRIQGKASE